MGYASVRPLPTTAVFFFDPARLDYFSLKFDNCFDPASEPTSDRIIISITRTIQNPSNNTVDCTSINTGQEKMDSKEESWAKEYLLVVCHFSTL